MINYQYPIHHSRCTIQPLAQSVEQGRRRPIHREEPAFRRRNIHRRVGHRHRQIALEASDGRCGDGSRCRTQAELSPVNVESAADRPGVGPAGNRNHRCMINNAQRNGTQTYLGNTHCPGKSGALTLWHCIPDRRGRGRPQVDRGKHKRGRAVAGVLGHGHERCGLPPSNKLHSVLHQPKGVPCFPELWSWAGTLGKDHATPEIW
jgi:hypothetical protein